MNVHNDQESSCHLCFVTTEVSYHELNFRRRGIYSSRPYDSTWDVNESESGVCVSACEWVPPWPMLHRSSFMKTGPLVFCNAADKQTKPNTKEKFDSDLTGGCENDST